MVINIHRQYLEHARFALVFLHRFYEEHGEERGKKYALDSYTEISKAIDKAIDEKVAKNKINPCPDP